ncbi:MAG TPA: TOBE domain-containing protein, partial [Candidatus Sulfotelmatobacter sp.]|nr:TOBE domain-containing protein [Candidatus Sulfotelmatobacter sp.]
SRYVAEFIGEANILTDGAGACRLLRPEQIDIALAPPADAAQRAVAGEVIEVGYQGSRSLYRVRTDDGAVLTVLRANRDGPGGTAIGFGARVHLSWPADAGTRLPG